MKRENDKWIDRRAVEIAATPQQVWDAWARPEHIAAWFADAAHGEPVTGGTLTHVFEKFGLEVAHQVVEAVPGERLVLDAVGPGGVPFRQEVHVRRQSGVTVLELVHSGFDDGSDWSDEFEGIDSGWTLALALLRHYVERYFGRRRTHYFVMRPAAFTFDRLEPWFRSEQGLADWLTRSGTVGEVGERVALELRTGDRITGEVLAWSGREAAVSWSEAEGALELKAFPMGGSGNAIALRACSWSATPPPVADVEAWMTEALDRLAARLA
jgi:uncharacterized protein YndB with AHSA1/START domain